MVCGAAETFFFLFIGHGKGVLDICERHGSCRVYGVSNEGVLLVLDIEQVFSGAESGDGFKE